MDGIKYSALSVTFFVLFVIVDLSAFFTDSLGVSALAMFPAVASGWCAAKATWS